MVYDQNEWNPSVITNFREGWNWQNKKKDYEKTAQIGHSAPRWTHRKLINTGVKNCFNIIW